MVQATQALRGPSTAPVPAPATDSAAARSTFASATSRAARLMPQQKRQMAYNLQFMSNQWDNVNRYTWVADLPGDPPDIFEVKEVLNLVNKTLAYANRGRAYWPYLHTPTKSPSTVRILMGLTAIAVRDAIYKYIPRLADGSLPAHVPARFLADPFRHKLYQWSKNLSYWFGQGRDNVKNNKPARG